MKSWAALVFSGQNDLAARGYTVWLRIFGNPEEKVCPSCLWDRHAAHLPFPARPMQLRRNKRIYSSWEHLKDVPHLLEHVP